jgi:hypothetical protein
VQLLVCGDHHYPPQLVRHLHRNRQLVTPNMENREEYAQSSLFDSWLEAAPFREYRGWYLRAFKDEQGWTWDIIEPKSRGGSWFESAKVYSNKSKAMLEARRLIIHSNVCWEMTQLLQDLYSTQSINLDEYRSMTMNLQGAEALTTLQAYRR